ncbi:serine hydrolase [Patescibacteria group bacterium]|nr:serine hydrolase [Patescibacteria group bacterium]
MNLWTFISTVILSLSLTSSQLYHLPTIILEQTQSGSKLSFKEQILDDSKKIPHKVDNKSLGVKISAQAAAVMDKDSGIILWQKNAGEIRPIASISKLMTTLVFLEHNPGWNTEVTMEEVDEVNGGTRHILRGETVIVKDLFYTSLIASDNNSINALVRSTGLSRQEFVNLMNKKAASLGMKNTKFSELTGLSEQNVSTALEVLTLAKTAFAKADIKNAVSQKDYNFFDKSGKAHHIKSTNLLFNSYLDVLAGKTGYIGASGYCLVLEIAGNDGQNIFGVVLGSESHDGRFQDLKILSGWILDNFVWS